MSHVALLAKPLALCLTCKRSISYCNNTLDFTFDARSELESLLEIFPVKTKILAVVVVVSKCVRTRCTYQNIQLCRASVKQKVFSSGLNSLKHNVKQ